MQHRALRPVLALCTLTMLAFGCGSDEPADADSARAGWRSAELAMAEAGVGLQPGGPATLELQWSGSATVDEDEVTATATASVSCQDGGSLTLDATAHTSDDLVTTHLEMTFDGCEADGVVVDGHLELDAEVTDAEVSSSILGDLTFSGDAQGTCEIDIGAHVTSTTVSAHSTVCGFDHDELFG